MAYQLVTFGQLTTELATRLSDPTNAFWSRSELQGYLIEALRTWQAFSRFYTQKANISTSPGVMFYDLAALIPGLAPTVTDWDLIRQIESHLMEPISASSWTGSEQFTYAGVLTAIQNRRDRYRLETGISLSTSEVDGPVPPDGVVDLDDRIIDVRRAMWKSAEGVYNILWPTDEFALTGGTADWFNNVGVPSDYSTILNQPLTLQLAPAPADNGHVHLITTNSGPALGNSIATVLGVPDDLTWIIKFGALADLFAQNGPAQDQARAKYCEARWTEGIELARITNFVKLGYQNGLPRMIDAMEELDTTYPSWVSDPPGEPFSLVVANNIAATGPIPDGVYALSFDVCPSMIVPQSDQDFIQVGSEIVDIVLDYAQHLSFLKEGINELVEANQLYANLIKLAAVYNDKLRANSQNFDVLSDRSNRESHSNPRRKTDINLRELAYEEPNA